MIILSIAINRHKSSCNIICNFSSLDFFFIIIYFLIQWKKNYKEIQFDIKE